MTGLIDNPYKPPAARVEDLPASNSIAAIDARVARACALLWWSFGASVLGLVLREAFSSATSSAAVRVIIAVVGAVLSFLYVLWITSKLKAGRNWMRWLFSLLEIGSLVVVALFWNYYKPTFSAFYSGNPNYAVMTAAQWILHLAAVVLINTPGARAWFAAMKRRQCQAS